MQLYSQGLISKQTRKSVYDMRGSSIATNALAVLEAVEARIAMETDSSPPFKNFCTVMSKYSSLQHISARMRKGMLMFLECFLHEWTCPVVSG